jgi:hypothetical protein
VPRTSRFVTRLGLLCAAVIAAACIDISTETSGPLAIEFAPLPYPAIVEGDTLRGPDGAVARLSARVFDGDGNVIADAPVTFGVRDTLDSLDLVTLTSDARVVAEPDTTGVTELIATSGTLQSNARQLQIVPKPDTFGRRGGGRDTLRVSVVTPDQNIVPDTAFQVLLRSEGSGASRRPVRGFIVSYELRYRGQPIPPTDTSHFYLMHEASRASSIDTTNESGIAGRRIRYRLQPGPIPALDTLVIVANVSYKGAPVTGSPVSLMLFIRPR